MVKTMPYQMTVAVHVHDSTLYASYREAIRPLLEALCAGFRYDFEIARTLRNDSSHEINRVFVLEFPSREAKERFFADPEYRAIRQRLFERAVDGTTILAEQDRQMGTTH